VNAVSYFLGVSSKKYENGADFDFDGGGSMGCAHDVTLFKVKLELLFFTMWYHCA
jgi:hypothetical protein